jgi:hypothetical protein
MTTFAIIEDGVITQLLVRDVLPPMHPDLAYVEVPDGTQRYQTFDGNTFGSIPVGPAETFEDRMVTSDAIMSRDTETLIDLAIARGDSLPQGMLDRHAAKKLVRSNG